MTKLFCFSHYRQFFLKQQRLIFAVENQTSSWTELPNQNGAGVFCFFKIDRSRILIYDGVSLNLKQLNLEALTLFFKESGRKHITA